MLMIILHKNLFTQISQIIILLHNEIAGPNAIANRADFETAAPYPQSNLRAQHAPDIGARIDGLAQSRQAAGQGEATVELVAPRVGEGTRAARDQRPRPGLERGYR